MVLVAHWCFWLTGHQIFIFIYFCNKWPLKLVSKDLDNGILMLPDTCLQWWLHVSKDWKTYHIQQNKAGSWKPPVLLNCSDLYFLHKLWWFHQLHSLFIRSETILYCLSVHMLAEKEVDQVTFNLCCVFRGDLKMMTVFSLVQVMDWIENHGEAFLSKHTGVGKSLHRARALQKRHDDFEDVAQVSCWIWSNV